MARLTRFQYDKRKDHDRKLILSVIVFLVVICLFYWGANSLSDSSGQRQMENLENALNRGIVHFYAAEGRYPADLAELKESYGLIYDEERFFVDYRLQGENIFPDVTIIEEVE